MAKARPSRREEIRRAAAYWVVRLSDSGCPASDRATFEAWRDADPAHDAAFEREQAAWTQLDRLRAYRQAGAAPDPDVLAPARRRSTLPPWSSWAAAAALVGAIGLGGALSLSTLAAPAFATGLGERRLVVLADGTRMEMNTSTKAVVRYRHGVREVHLIRGEAAFDVARDGRPFMIRTPEGRLSAADAEVAVRMATPDAATISVRDGRVSAVGKTSGILAVVGPAQSARLKDGRVEIRTVGLPEIDRALAWRRGAISLDGQRLGEAVVEFNRYNARKIVVADPKVASLRLGGYFQTSDSAGFVRAVTQAFPVAADTAPDGTVRLRAGG